MKHWLLFTLAVFATIFLVACDGQINLFGSPTQIQGGEARPTPSPSPSPSPGGSPDPCAPPVTGVHLSGPTSVLQGDTFIVDVTPVSASGPLEGPLDYCNLRGRTPVVESASPNVRQAGGSTGFRLQFLALAPGPFTIRIRVDNVSAEFSGIVTKASLLSDPLLDPCKKFICPDSSPTPTPAPRCSFWWPPFCR